MIFLVHLCLYGFCTMVLESETKYCLVDILPTAKAGGIPTYCHRCLASSPDKQIASFRPPLP